MSSIRRAVMRRLARAASRAARTPITDSTSGFRCIAEPLLSEFARSFPTHYLGDTYEAVVVAGRNGYRICELPVHMSAREIGDSSASPFAAAKLVVACRADHLRAHGVSDPPEALAGRRRLSCVRGNDAPRPRFVTPSL